MNLHTTRRSALAALATGFAGGLAGCLNRGTSGDPAALDGSWPMARADAANTARAAETTSPGDEWDERWSRQFDANLPTPAVHDQTVYAVTGNPGTLVALEHDGTTHWETDAATYRYTPAVSGEFVLVGGDDGLVAVDRSDGTVVWTVEGGRAGAPTVAGESVVVGLADEVHAVDVADGSRRWRASMPDAWRTIPALDGEDVAVGQYRDDGGGVVLLDRASGDRQWAEDTDGTAGSPVLTGDAVLAGFDDGSVRAFDRQDGTECWHADGAGTELAVADGRVYVGLGSLSAHDLATGEREWHWRPSEGADAITSPPVVGSGEVYVGTGHRGGRLSVLDAASGQHLTDYQVTDSVNAPALAGETVVASNAAGKVAALEFRS